MKMPENTIIETIKYFCLTLGLYVGVSIVLLIGITLIIERLGQMKTKQLTLWDLYVEPVVKPTKPAEIKIIKHKIKHR